jgi:hypothetical protein
MNSLPTQIFRSAHRPQVQTHALYLINDAFVEFLLSEVSPPRVLPIVTNHYCKPLTPGPFILYNTEQLTVPKYLEEVVERAKQPDILEVWDYSEVNTKLLQQNGIQVRHVPVKTTPERVASLKHLLATEPKEYDCGFCGVAPPRRLEIVEKLGQQGVKVLLMTQTYGPERDRMLARCRFQLNIHQTDKHTVFEATRCDPWLEAGQQIVSEDSLDNDSRCINVPYDKLVEAAVELKNRLTST